MRSPLSSPLFRAFACALLPASLRGLQLFDLEKVESGRALAVSSVVSDAFVCVPAFVRAGS